MHSSCINEGMEQAMHYDVKNITITRTSSTSDNKSWNISQAIFPLAQTEGDKAIRPVFLLRN